MSPSRVAMQFANACRAIVRSPTVRQFPQALKEMAGLSAERAVASVRPGGALPESRVPSASARHRGQVADSESLERVASDLARRRVAV